MKNRRKNQSYHGYISRIAERRNRAIDKTLGNPRTPAAKKPGALKKNYTSNYKNGR